MNGSLLHTPHEWSVWSVRRFLGDSVPVRWGSDGDQSASKPHGTGSWIPRRKGSPIFSALSERSTQVTDHYIQYWHQKLYLCSIKLANHFIRTENCWMTAQLNFWLSSSPLQEGCQCIGRWTSARPPRSTLHCADSWPARQQEPSSWQAPQAPLDPF